MDWNDVAKQVIGLGAPILGAALGGPLGGAAGKILAEALGTDATPAAINDVLTRAQADSTAAAAAAGGARAAEDNWLAALAMPAKPRWLKSVRPCARNP